MKLINCTTLRIEEFPSSSTTKPYAILSHRWEVDEVTYQEINRSQTPTHKAGWTKIREACRVARSMGYEYVWLDTCCINKQDFAELNEAINSMFKWYAGAGVCIAYLSDVHPEHPSLENSLWFTRGWTLPELIAPEVVEFFDSAWNSIGTRAELCGEIHRITRINPEILLHDVPPGKTIEGLLSKVPVGRRMSWASARTTTREEDMAYSLLGILGINMPLLYGEGSNAFMRLQMEIMKETNDMTLFAWTCPSANPYQQVVPEYRGILATSPREFEKAIHVVFTRDIKHNPEYTMTNTGLRIEAELVEGDNTPPFIMLGCKWDDGAAGDVLAIALKAHGGGVFYRARPDKFGVLSGDIESGTRKATIYIKKHIEVMAEPPVYTETQPAFRKAYQFHTNGSRRVAIARVVPESRWNHHRKMFVTEGLNSFEGFVEFRLPSEGTGLKSFIVACGFAAPHRDWICMATSHDENRLIYDSAIKGDLERLRRHAVTAKQVYNSQVTTELPSEAAVTVRTRLRDTEPIFDIHVEVITQCLIM